MFKKKTYLRDMTIDEFMEVTGLVEEKKKLDSAIQKYNELLSQSKDVVDISKGIFKDAEHLSTVSTPFELKSQEELDALFKDVSELIEKNVRVLMAVATQES